MTEGILSNLRAANTVLAEVQNDIHEALNAAPEDLERLGNNVADKMKCAEAHLHQAFVDLKIHRGAK
jgi:hypothetical protein